MMSDVEVSHQWGHGNRTKVEDCDPISSNAVDRWGGFVSPAISPLAPEWPRSRTPARTRINRLLRAAFRLIV